MRPAAWRAELSKLYRQRISYAGFVVVFMLVALITWGSHHEQDHLDVGERMGSEFIVAGKSVTALFVAYTAMEVALVVLVPLLIAVVVGGLVAGERQTGTLRTLLSRPVSRRSVLAAKLVTGWSYAIALTFFLGLSALALGQLVFGWGDLVIFRGGLTILEPRMGLMRLAQGYALASAAMCTVATIGLMFSVLFDSSMVAAGLTVAVLVVSGTAGMMPYFEHVKPHLLTTHLAIYQKVFAATVDRPGLADSAMHLGAYALVSLVIAMIVFERRDVTC